MNLKVFAESLNLSEINELLNILMEIKREDIRPLIDEEKVMVAMGEFIRPLQSYRTRLNSSLYEAKAAVDNYWNSIRVKGL